MPENSELDLLAGLKITLSSIREEMERNRVDRARRDIQARAAETPRLVRLNGAVVIPAGGFAWIPLNFRGPDSGHFWMVRQIVIGGLTPITAAAGRADVFVSAQDFTNSTLAAVGLLDWRDQATALPLVGPYGKGEMYVKADEYLQIAISNGTPGQQYVCGVMVEDFQEAKAVREWGV